MHAAIWFNSKSLSPSKFNSLKKSESDSLSRKSETGTETGTYSKTRDLQRDSNSIFAGFGTGSEPKSEKSGIRDWDRDSSKYPGLCIFKSGNPGPGLRMLKSRIGDWDRDPDLWNAEFRDSTIRDCSRDQRNPGLGPRDWKPLCPDANLGTLTRPWV